MPGLSPRRVVGRGKLRGKVHEAIVVDEYWLDRFEALLVVMRSEAPLRALERVRLSRARERLLSSAEALRCSHHVDHDESRVRELVALEIDPHEDFAGIHLPRCALARWRGEIVAPMPFTSSAVQIVSLDGARRAAAADPRKLGEASVK